MGPEDHPAVHLCHDWGPPESMMRPEVFVHSRAQAEQLPAAEADQLPACPHCQGGRYAPHGDPGWPDALCQTCGGSGIAYGASEDQPED